MTLQYQCCFCGTAIEPISPDVGSLLYTSNWDKSKDLQSNQALYCHSTCLQAKLHPSVHLYALAELSDHELTQEEKKKLPDWLR
jgi:hypothetical protein